MRRRILVLFPDEWDLAAADDPRFRDRYEFLYEGFDLFSFPDNARLFTFDALAFVEKMVRRYRGGGLAGVVTSDEQFGPFLASLVAERLGLPHASLEAVLTIQHKYYSRLAFEGLAPGANPRFGLLRRGFSRPEEVPMAYPFYVKPAKAAFSVLARRVDSFEQLYRHTRFAWLEGAIIERLVRPFADVMRAHSSLVEDPFSMVCEEVIRGRQVTANGYARDGRVAMLGTVDSVMYPGTDQFQRFQYPSTLPAETLSRIDALAARLLEGLGFRHGMFNIEMRVDPASGTLRVIEVNPRAAGQFYDLFERVDGYSLFEALLDLECGLTPRIRRGEGRQRHAASFVLRDLAGEGLSRWPSARRIARLRSEHPDAHVMIYRKRGADLKREMKWLGSYRYGVFNTGGATLEEMFGR
ncbi:MAG TPA: ATP-grasp domain-containing protein, partial [Usitatibacter sp.]|nr:ATP-grasp domain-containing protein [Usitatibacter sp.]